VLVAVLRHSNEFVTKRFNTKYNRITLSIPVIIIFKYQLLTLHRMEKNPFIGAVLIKLSINRISFMHYYYNNIVNIRRTT